jgi:hypothetical protein
MAVESPPWALQLLNYNAEQTRRAVFVGFASGGVVGSGSMQISIGSGISVNISTGACLVAGTYTNKQGLYYMYCYATDNEVGSAADPSNPRVDRICATVDDASYSGAANDDKLQIVKGTATVGATLSNLSGAPALPANSTHLGYALILAAGAAYSSVQNSQVYTAEGVGSPYGLYYNSATTSVGTASTQISLGGTGASNYGMSISSSNAVIPAAGVYWIVGAVAFASGSSLKTVSVEQNGSAVLGSVPGGVGGASVAGGVTCSVGDTIGLYATTTSGNVNTVTGNGNTYLHLVYQSPK